jgi:hypothetical protein
MISTTLLFLLPLLGPVDQCGVQDQYCQLHGRVRFVDAFADYRIQFVDMLPDARVMFVTDFQSSTSQCFPWMPLNEKDC